MPIGGNKPARGEAVQQGMTGFKVPDRIIQRKTPIKKEKVKTLPQIGVNDVPVNRVYVYDEDAAIAAWQNATDH
jgi:hypothetical protein